MRVGFQTLTDFTDVAFPITGVSGILEVSGLTVWGIHLWAIMNGKIRAAVPKATPHRGTLAAGQPIAAGSIVADVLRVYPETLGTFLDHGFKPLANPVLRRTVAATVSVQGAARLLDVDLEELLKALNASRECGTTSGIDQSQSSKTLATKPA
jgi:hypothetical protein